MLLKMIRIIGISFASLALSAATTAAELSITLTDVTSDAGDMRIALYDSKEAFNRIPIRAITIPAQKGEMSIDLSDLPVGNYAVMLYHDIDGNAELDKNLLGMPIEPWGASLGGRPIFGAPDWMSSHFTLPEAGTSISIKMR